MTDRRRSSIEDETTHDTVTMSSDWGGGPAPYADKTNFN